MTQYAGTHVERRERRAQSVEVADVHDERRRHDEMRDDVAVAVELRADDGERRVTAGSRTSDRAVHDVGQTGSHVQTHSKVVPTADIYNTRSSAVADRPRDISWRGKFEDKYRRNPCYPFFSVSYSINRHKIL